MPDVPAGACPEVSPAAAPDFDVLVVGAGLSGVGAGCHLQAGATHEIPLAGELPDQG